jgi:hypothetical protein
MSEPDDLLPPQRLRTMQIIAGAMVMGVVIFLALAVFLVQTNGQGKAPPPGLPLVSIIAAGFFILAASLAYFIPATQTRVLLRKIASGAWQPPPGPEPSDSTTDAATLLSVRQTTLILTLAPLEGAAFFCGIAYLLEAQAFVLGVAIVALVLMLLNFPTANRIGTWLEQQSNRLADLRQQADLVGEG